MPLVLLDYVSSPHIAPPACTQHHAPMIRLSTTSAALIFAILTAPMAAQASGDMVGVRMVSCSERNVDRCSHIAAVCFHEYRDVNEFMVRQGLCSRAPMIPRVRTRPLPAPLDPASQRHNFAVRNST